MGLCARERFFCNGRYHGGFNRYGFSSLSQLLLTCSLDPLSSRRIYAFQSQVLPAQVLGQAAVSFTLTDGSVYLAISSQSAVIIQYYDGAIFRTKQTIVISYGQGVIVFNMGGQTYMSVANFQTKGGSYAAVSPIYKWLNGAFVSFQNITTFGAIGSVHFSWNGNDYLAFANYEDDSLSTRITSPLYIFNQSISKFTLFQSMSTIGAAAVQHFESSESSVLLFANYYDSALQTYQVSSTVWLQQPSGKFSLIQNIPTGGASFWETIVIGTYTFCAIANNVASGGSPSTNSMIYRWNRATTRLESFQAIPTYAAMDWQALVLEDQYCLMYASNGAVSSGYSSASVVYCYSAAASQFAATTSIPTIGAYDITSFDFNGKSFVAIISSTSTTSSVLYQVRLLIRAIVPNIL